MENTPQKWLATPRCAAHQNSQPAVPNEHQNGFEIIKGERLFLAQLEKLKLFPFLDNLTTQKEQGKVILKTDIFTSTSTSENFRGKQKKKKKVSSLYLKQVPQSKSPCGQLVIFICQMFEMLLDFVCHMSRTARRIVCTQLRCNPKSHVIFWAWRRREDAKK